MILGIAGGVVGGYITALFGIGAGGTVGGLIVTCLAALAGALLLVWLSNRLKVQRCHIRGSKWQRKMKKVFSTGSGRF